MSEAVEITLISWLVYLINGVIIFIYNEKFLQRKSEQRRLVLIQWTIIYTITQILLIRLTELFYPYNSFINIVPYMITIFALQMIFFEKNRPKQLFIILSVTAGWEILRFLVSPLAYIFYNLWNPFFIWLVNDWLIVNFTDNNIWIISFISRCVNFIIIFVCRTIHLVFLAGYLYIISKQFVRRDYELSANESVFLIFPCITVICIDLTVKLMAVSVDNGAVHLIYSRVPETAFLLPLISLLLLGSIITSVILFKSLVKSKDEEQKRLLLENRVIEVNREIEELSNVYADIRGLKHDLRNHISNINAYVRQYSDDSDLNHYLNQMARSVEKLDFFYKTGNAIIDIILHQSLQNARKKNIRFEADFHCPKDLLIDIYDLSIILNNALQNALEASEKIVDSAIYIRSYLKGSFYFIEIENNFDGLIELNENDLPTTTKSDKHLHGLGLANIRRCAYKYNGDLDIEVKDNKFNLTIMLQLQKN